MFDTLLDAYNKGQDMLYAANALIFNKEYVPKYWQERFDYLADKLMKQHLTLAKSNPVMENTSITGLSAFTQDCLSISLFTLFMIYIVAFFMYYK